MFLDCSEIQIQCLCGSQEIAKVSQYEILTILFRLISICKKGTEFQTFYFPFVAVTSLPVTQTEECHASCLQIHGEREQSSVAVFALQRCVCA